MLHGVCDWVYLHACVRISSSPEQPEVSKHEWYHVVTNCLGHDFSQSLFTKSSQKIVKKCQKVVKSTFDFFDNFRLLLENLVS